MPSSTPNFVVAKPAVCTTEVTFQMHLKDGDRARARAIGTVPGRKGSQMGFGLARLLTADAGGKLSADESCLPVIVRNDALFSAYDGCLLRLVFNRGTWDVVGIDQWGHDE